MAGLLPYLRLLRAGTLFSPAADVVAGACIVAAGAAAPWSVELARAAGASVLLYAAGMVWNDVADRREDAVQRPERPIPSGAVGLGAAVVLGVLLLGAGCALSPSGHRLHHGAIAALVLAYDFACKRSVLAGALTMGVLRGLNLAVAAAPAYGDAPRALLAAAVCYALYIVAVTILGTFEDQPRVRPRAVVAIQTGPMVAAFAGLLAVQGGLWPAPALALVPIVAFGRRNRLVPQWDQPAIRRSMMFLLLGTMGYTALLCGAAGRWDGAAAVLLCIPAARAVTRALRQRTLT